ncbi:MAG: FG-GAP-like repeat-containing protein [Pirellulales bacterium]
MIVSSLQGVTLWSNRGDWTFANFTEYSRLPDPSKPVHGILAMDVDRNVLNDFVLAMEGQSPVWLSNNLHGRYRITDWKQPAKASIGGKVIEAIDVNRDACWDLLNGSERGLEVQIMKSVGRHGWILDRQETLTQRPVLGVSVADLDWDGISDCVAWGPEGLMVFRGNAEGRLKLEAPLMVDRKDVRSVALCDVDADGDDDGLVLNASGDIEVLLNSQSRKNHSLEVVIRADEDGKQRPRERCNMHGVGSLIEMKIGGAYQAKIVRGTRTVFGLGEQDHADVARILWTNGIPNNVIDIAHKKTIFDQQNLGGSCPYLYAWDGERFSFCTDCLWAAPIGLQFAQGVSAPTRDWEYLKLEGSAIQPRNNRYVLQVTEELWEAAYFDTVQLWAIDHPADVEIFTNEKVGPASIAEHKIHVVQQRREPKSILDQRGRDWKSVASKRDQQYTKCWEEGYHQGLVKEHWLEIDLQDGTDDARHGKLFLTGWVFPTCTSINLAMTENPTLPKLTPPRLLVPDEHGEWKEVLPYAGFPGGKTKTIVIDLQDLFLCNDYRVRIATNMELCWDEVFWSASQRSIAGGSFGRTNAFVQAMPLVLKELISIIGDSPNWFSAWQCPKHFQYDAIETESIWPPMLGKFTRYGDMLPLVREPDDMQVVLGAGDEMTLEFEVPEQKLPDGWKRDFVIYNVGWDKDADLNTVHGQSVEPLPFRAMERYPYEPEQEFPSSEIYKRYLRTYQTRGQQPTEFWNQIRDARMPSVPSL